MVSPAAAVVAGACLCCLLLAGVDRARAQSAQTSDARRRADTKAAQYLSYVRDYQAGDDGALNRLHTFWIDADSGDKAIWASLPTALAPAAIVMHCDLALRAYAVEEDEVGAKHFQIAGRIARLDAVSADASEQARRARRGYYLLAAWSLAGRLDVTPLFLHLEAALGLFPDSPELLLASASLEELFIDLEGRGRPTPVRASATHDRHDAALRGARQSAIAKALYARAIAAAASDPASQAAGLEARVRLARMHLRARHAAGARRELDAAFETFERLDSTHRRAVRRVEYLAYLLAGRVAGDAGDWQEARRAYAQAGGLCVAAQSAPIGQSFALLMAANEAGARAMTAAVLAMSDAPAPNSAAPNSAAPGSAAPGNAAPDHPAARAASADLCSGDPWIDYPSGQEWRLDGMLAELRAMVRS